MLNRTPQRRRAVTLVELTVSTAVAVVLIGGLASAVVIASRAIPDEANPTRVTIDGYYAAEQIAGELLCAQSFTERSATTVEFTVSNRDKPCDCDTNPTCHPDCAPETIRYEWDGTPGDALTRQYNGGPIVEVVEDVHEFDLTYGIKTKSETTIEEGTTWSDEIELTSFDGWGSLTPPPTPQMLGPGYLCSEYFEIIPPEGANEMKVTRAEVVLAHTGTPPNTIELSIRRSKGDGSYEPAVTPIGTPASIPGSIVTTLPDWKGATFADVVVSDLARQDYCLVVEVPATPPAYLYYRYAKTAPDNGMYMRWTTDGGASWSPSSNQINQQDIRFCVYGSFATTGTQEITVDQYFVTSTRIALRVGLNPSTRVETSVQVLNTPEVASP